MAHPDLFEADVGRPEGFLYRTDVIDRATEAALAARLAELDFKPFDFRGYLANRKVLGFGLRYDYSSRQVQPAPPIPDWLLDLRAAAAAFAERPAEAFVQVLINEYKPGAGVGWHKDKPHFDEVIGVSLLAPCVLRFRRSAGETWERHSLRLQPGSAYLLTGPSRTDWEHSVPPVIEHRYSITFRSLRARRTSRAGTEKMFCGKGAPAER